MYHYIFRPLAEKELKKLPRNIQIQIIRKLRFFISTPNPLMFASHLKDSDLGSYRFRIGDYRVIFDLKEKNIIIHSIGHRREIYR